MCLLPFNGSRSLELITALLEKGRAFFRVPGRFETSLIMTGAHEDDIWAFVSVEFLFNIPNGENKGIKGQRLGPLRSFIVNPC